MSEIVIDSFVALYKHGCRIKGEEDEHVKMYEDLDNLTIFINSQKEETYKIIMMGFSPDRICITVPYDSAIVDHRRLPEGKDKDGNPVSFITLLSSSMVSLVIDQMDNEYIPGYFDEEKELVTWKLKRLEKMYNMGWEKFVNQYIDGL